MTWIHFSDWHYGEAEDLQTQDDIRNALVRDVRNRLQLPYQYAPPGGESISFRLPGQADFVFFSGDASFQGKAAGFAGATRLIEGVRQAAGVPPERVFVVPGNHDLERERITGLKPELQESLTNAPPGALKPFIEGQDLADLRQPFEAFRQFARPYAFSEPDVSSALTGTLARNDIRFTISGFNSALYCGRKALYQGQPVTNDYGGLFLAQREQALPALSKARLDSEAPHVRVALIHHPFSWLHPATQAPVTADLISHFHFILMGHEHQPRLNWISQAAGEAAFIPAGATFHQDRGKAGARRPLEEMGIAYNIVHLDFRRGIGFVILRLYRKQAGRLGFYYDNRDKVGWPTGIFLLDHLPGYARPAAIPPLEDTQPQSLGETIDIRLAETVSPDEAITFLSDTLPTQPIDENGQENGETSPSPINDN